MNFDFDAFVSYAEIDNRSLIKGSDGWVSDLHRALELRVPQFLGKPVKICRDAKRAEEEALDEKLASRLRRVASLVSVVSPAYIKSDLNKKEVLEFWKAAEAIGGVRFRDKARIFKVLKTPVPPDKQVPQLRNLLGYEFFKVDPETGRVRELNEVFGESARAEYWMRLDDLAQDICNLLEAIEGSDEPTGQPKQTFGVYVAETTADLREQRDSIRRDLLEHGYEVFPAHALSVVASEVRESAREDLRRCRMSIHLIGKNYGFIPEGGTESLLEIQSDLARERAEKGEFSHLLWIPAGLGIEDERQQKMIARLRTDLRDVSDLLEGTLEDLKTEIQSRLQELEDLSETLISLAPARNEREQLYLIYDRRDADAVNPWVDHLLEKGIGVLRPVFDDDELRIREHHERCLQDCDGALILYGLANERWVQQKLREIQKSPGYRRVKPAPDVGIALLPPRTAEKARFRPFGADMIPQWEGLNVEALQPFVSLCQKRRPSHSSEIVDDTASAKRALEIGATLLGRYDVLEELGAGGMGRVYRAWDYRLIRDVAIKVLPERLRVDPEARNRFRKEAQALAQFSHPNIAVLFNVEETSGLDCLVMEFVHGQTLKDKLASGALPEEQIVSLGVQMAAGLEAAHQKGLIHRDLKPGNIMVTPDGQVKLLDFGLAKFLSNIDTTAETKNIAGTLPYMAPEQLEYESLDARTDIYGLGTVLFEMATGRRAFPETMAMHLMHAILNQQAEPVRSLRPGLSEELERIIAKALEKKRELRYQTAADLRADLAKLCRST